MHLVVTAGATYESMDRVRRLTNFSTGKLGSELASFLAGCGHTVILLLSESSTYLGKSRGQTRIGFTSTDDLRCRLRALKSERVDGIFHAAAVSDFRFGKVYRRSSTGELQECVGGKFSTREGDLLAELIPTPKIIKELRTWYPTAFLVGWKYETDGDRNDVCRKAADQIAENNTDAAVANGPAYGFGFGVITAAGLQTHFSKVDALFTELERLAGARVVQP